MIKNKKIKIGITGDPDWGNILTNKLQKTHLNVEYYDISFINILNISKILQKNVIHFIFSPLTNLKGLIFVFLLKVFKKKIIIMWIGTDVLLIKKGMPNIYNTIGQKLIDVNITTTNWLSKELKENGVKNKVIKAPPFYKKLLPCKLPKFFTVLIYLPDKRFTFYGGEICGKIMENFKDIQFLIVANEGINMIKRKNIKYLGWVDNMNDVYCKTTVLIRVPIHDALSCMITEALSIGRYVIWSYPLKGCFYAKNYDDIVHYLNKLINTPNLELNQEGINFFLEYDKERELFLDSLNDIYNSLGVNFS